MGAMVALPVEASITFSVPISLPAADSVYATWRPSGEGANVPIASQSA